MAEINFPCRMCGGKLIVIDSVITCVTCNAHLLARSNVVKPEIPSNVEFGRKSERVLVSLYHKKQRKEKME